MVNHLASDADIVVRQIGAGAGMIGNDTYLISDLQVGIPRDMKFADFL